MFEIAYYLQREHVSNIVSCRLDYVLVFGGVRRLEKSSGDVVRSVLSTNYIGFFPHH